jgi:hypothetical protein
MLRWWDRQQVARNGRRESVEDRIGLIGYAYELTDSEFHPSKALLGVHRSLDFLGHGASKWTDERDKFVNMLVHLDDQGEKCGVRVLVLDPKSPMCLQTSAQLFPDDPHKWPRKILHSLQVLGALEDTYDKLKVKVYKHKPVFRLTIIDGATAIIGHYRNYRRDSDHSPLLVFSSDADWSFFTPFQLLYDAEWNAALTVDWEAVAEQMDELGIERMGG